MRRALHPSDTPPPPLPRIRHPGGLSAWRGAWRRHAVRLLLLLQTRTQTQTQTLRLTPRLRLTLLLALLATLLLAPLASRAQSVDLKALTLERRDGELVLEFNARLSLGPAIEDALQRGVPMYFQAQTVVYRNRWYWRDERITRVNRSWRLAYQPLTGAWRVSLGGLSQGYATLPEALAPLSRVSGWRLLEGEKLEPGERYYVDFSFRLDNSQLPQPMQIDLGGDWKLSVERTLRIE